MLFGWKERIYTAKNDFKARLEIVRKVESRHIFVLFSLLVFNNDGLMINMTLFDLY